MIVSLPLLVSDLEKIQDNIEDDLGKISSLRKKLHIKLEKSTTKKVKDYTRIITPLAAFSSSNLRTNVELNVKNDKYQTKNNHIPAVEENYALKRSLDKSFSNFNDEHSSLMTRSIFSTSF